MAKGKPTARSQNYLRSFGYPSARELRREAQGLASASVPTVRSVQRPYERQLQSSRDFLAAVQAALRDTSSQVGTGYDTAIAQSQGVDQAAQQRLAALGLAPEAAVAQAGGDNATQNLIANSASAKNYAAQLPGIAAGQAYVGQQGINKNLTDALANRRDQLSQSFFQALQTVQGQALQQASFNQQAQAQQQNLALQYAQMGQQQSQFNQEQAFRTRQANRQYGLARDNMIAQYGFDPTTGEFIHNSPTAQSNILGLAQKYHTTPSVISSLQTHASAEMEKLLKNGTPWREALTKAEQENGVFPELARQALISTYGSPPPLPSAQPFSDGNVSFQPPHGMTPIKVAATLARKGIAKNAIQGYLVTSYTPYFQQYMAIFNALKGFKVDYVYRQLQHAYDSVLHPSSSSSEH